MAYTGDFGTPTLDIPALLGLPPGGSGAPFGSIDYAYTNAEARRRAMAGIGGALGATTIAGNQPATYQPAPYVTPTARINQLRAHGVSEQALHQQAVDYATRRLAVLRALAPQIAGLSQAASGSDPLAAYKTASGLVTQAAQHAGYADPRMYITALLAGGHHGL